VDTSFVLNRARGDPPVRQEFAVAIAALTIAASDLGLRRRISSAAATTATLLFGTQ
jgi:hypothetical protein